MRQITSSTLSNQSLATALLCHTYTADADREVFFRLFADQVAGNGVYTAYVTIQRLGAGSAYEVQPRTAPTVASGITSIMFTTVAIPVKNTDVIKVYLLGLAGDTTTPDIVTEVWEADYPRPVTPGQHSFNLDSSGRVLLQPTQTGVTIPTVTDITNGVTLTAGTLTSIASSVWASASRTLTSFGTLVSDIWANGTRTLTSFGTLAADVWTNGTRTLTSFGTLAADVWTNGTRTLTSFGTLLADIVDAVEAALSGGISFTFTQTPTEIAAAVQGDRLTIHRDSDWIARLYVTGGISAVRDNLIFTVKTKLQKANASADSQSILQISENDGLLIINNAAGTSSKGSLTVVDESDTDGNGVVDLTLDSDTAALLEPEDGLMWDMKEIDAGADLVRVEGLLDVKASVTRTISS